MNCVAFLSSSEVSALCKGTSCTTAREPHSNSRIPIVIFSEHGGRVDRACRNKCRHAGGRFIPDIEHIGEVKCTSHGWRLDPASMEYTEPAQLLSQMELTLEKERDGTVRLLEQVPRRPWEDGDGCEKHKLSPGEMVITYMSHACILIEANGTQIAMDPWLLGPAFGRGWWLKHRPPPDALERVANSDAIFISHAHSDHLNIPTLDAIQKIRPEVPIRMGAIPNRSIWTREAESLDFRDVRQLNMEVCTRFCCIDVFGPFYDHCLHCRNGTGLAPWR